MNNHIDILLNDSQIRELIDSQRGEYIFSQLNVKGDAKKDLSKIIRIAFLLINHTLNPNFKALDSNENKELLKKAYILLCSIDIRNQDEQILFQSIMGIEEVEPKTLYYFYLAAIGLKSRENIKVRIDLAGFQSVDNATVLSDWKRKVLNDILESFILLVRKGGGFRDVKKALEIIMTLREEQKKFEDKHLEKNKESEYGQALSLLAWYHTSKAVVETADYLIQGYSYKANLEIIIRQHSDLALNLLEIEPRQKSLVAILEYSLQTLRSNSIWERTKGLGDYVRKLCDFKARQQNIIELLPSQTDALSKRLLDAQSSVTVLQMPTSAGKTLLAEFYILQTIALQRDAKIVYVVPSRALVNQVYNDLKTDLDSLGLVVEKTSSAIEVDPSESELLETEEIHVLVSTPEKLDLLIRRNHSSVENISLIVVDEAHTISNGERGTKLELLMSILKRERPNSKFLLLTPFLGERGQENMVNWLAGGDSDKVKTPIKIDWKPAEKLTVGISVKSSRKHGPIFTLSTLPSPYTIIEKEDVKKTNPIVGIESTGEKDKVAEFTAKQFAKDNKAILYLCRGRNTADKRAKFLEDFCALDGELDDRILVQKFIEEEVGKPTLLTTLLDKRIAVHHAGLSDETKLLVEHLIREKQIKYICATTTIAEGVNFPVSTVFFDTFERGKTPNRQNIPLTTNDFWNIAGRAGRTLVDNFGTIIFPFTGDNEPKARRLIENSSNELASCLIKFLIDYERIKAAFSDIEARQEKAILMDKHHESLSPLVQYLIHLLLVGKNYYLNEIQDLFKDSLCYYMLNADDRQKFLDICMTLYNYLNQQNKATLSFADKTGFSVPSVLEAMRAKRDNPLVNNLDSWEPHILFDKNNSEPLAEKIRVIAALKETKMGTEADNAPFNPDLIAKILIGWVKGDKLATMSSIHPFYNKFPTEGERINEFIKDINDRRFKASWGLSALEGIVRGNENEIKDSFVPSYVYFGVDNEKSLLLRMVGIPRSLAFSMIPMINNNAGKMTYAEVRKNIIGLSDKDWEGLIPKNSNLNTAEWKRITEILVK